MSDAPDRHARRRLETRAKLLQAARVLFGRQGVELTRIQAITDEANVGFGSFYNHFESKDALVEAVLADAVELQAAEVDALNARLDDPAEVIAAAHRSFVRRAGRDPEWAWLLIRLDVSHDILLNSLGPYAVRDLQTAIDAGRLTVPDAAIALRQTGGALLAVMRAVLDGAAPEDADIHHAEGILKLLGLPPVEASEIARRPLPDPVSGSESSH